jgi:hypothetical protein
MIGGCCCLALTVVGGAEPDRRAAAAAAALEAVPFPGGKVLSPLPDQANWRVTFTYADGAADTGHSAPLPVSLTLTKAAPLALAVLTDTAGQRREAWADGFGVYLTTPDVPYPYAANRGIFKESEPWLNSAAAGFPGFAWVAEKNFIGRQKANGAVCLVFRQDDVTAWIDAATRLPVRWQGAGETREFTRLSPPEQPLTLPENVGELSEKAQRNHQNNHRRAPVGG